MEFSDFLKNLQNKEKAVIKELPMRPHWKSMQNELANLKNKLLEMTKEWEFKKRRMWIIIEEESGERGDMRINDEKNVIEVLED